MKYAFIEAHRAEFSVRSMCRVLAVHFSGFYAWVKEPLSQRALEDVRQTELIHEAWTDSGKVYGYRKLTDDLRDQGETCSENRVARLASLAGISAQIGYRRRPSRYGGKPAVIADRIGSSRLMSQTVFGSPILHTSEPMKAGRIWLWSSICSHGVSLAGRYNPA